MNRLCLAAALLLALMTAQAEAQSALSTANHSRSIATGLTYQQVAPSDMSRRMVQVQNNNTNTDNCWVNDDGVVASGNTTATSVTVDGNTITSAQASILLQPGEAYTRYYPYVPDGPIVVTCTSTADSVYVGIH